MNQANRPIIIRKAKNLMSIVRIRMATRLAHTEVTHPTLKGIAFLILIVTHLTHTGFTHPTQRVTQNIVDPRLALNLTAILMDTNIMVPRLLVLRA
jgi:hypothetical protein